MNTFEMQIVTPFEPAHVQIVSLIDVPAANGRLTVLAGHEPFICSLTDGIVRATDATGKKDLWMIDSGTMTVDPKKATILVRSATRTTESNRQ